MPKVIFLKDIYPYTKGQEVDLDQSRYEINKNNVEIKEAKEVENKAILKPKKTKGLA